MSKTKKVILGILTAWPIAYMFLFFVFVLSLIAASPGGDSIAPFIFLVIPLHFLTIFLVIGLQIFYLVDLFKNERVTKDFRIVWVIALVLGGMFAMPVYWYMNIWKEADLETGNHPGLPSSEGFESADEAARTTMTGDPVPPEPHSWR